MRLVLHDFGGYPFSAQLARTLARRGHEVTYLHAAGFKEPRADVAARTGDPASLRFHGIDVATAYHNRAGPRRFAQERKYGRLLAEAIDTIRPNAVLSANCPLDAQAMALDAAHGAGAGFGFWVQDLYSLAVNRLLRRRLGPIGGLIGARFGRLERSLLRRSDAVVPIAPDFQMTLEAWGVPAERITVIENWAPLDAAPPLSKANDWSQRHGLADQPTFIYSGTLGRKHDPTLLVALANAVPRAQVVVVAEGSGADRLRQTDGLPANLIVMPMQPSSIHLQVLASADVLVAILASDSHAFSVPSKVLAYLAAGRAIIAAIPAENLAARTILRAGAGIVVNPDDSNGLVVAAQAMLADDASRLAAGAAARAYAEKTFDADRKADEFEAVLDVMARRSHSRTQPNADTAATPL